jgi:hypothetical protein
VGHISAGEGTDGKGCGGRNGLLRGSKMTDWYGNCVLFSHQFRFLFCPEPVLVKSPGPFLTLRNLSTDAPPFLQGRRGPRAGPGVVTAAASEQTGHHLRRPASPDRCLRHNGYTCWRQHCRARCLRTGEVPAPSKTHNMPHPISSTIRP